MRLPGDPGAICFILSERVKVVSRVIRAVVTVCHGESDSVRLTIKDIFFNFRWQSEICVAHYRVCRPRAER